MRGGDTSYNSPPPSPSPSPSLAPKNNSPMLYYGLVVLAIAIYNFIIVKWCSNQQRQLGDADLPPEVASLSRRRLDGSSVKNLGTSFKYKKGEETLKSGYDNHECPVCLSVFVEDEDVRQLPSCRHSFHALCIDMWLYSHLDCPLCRAPVGLSDVHRTLENSSEVLVDPGIHV